MGLIEQFTGLFRRAETATKTTAEEVARPPRLTTAVGPFAVERSRREIVEVCRKMYDEDARADGVLRTLARDATMGGFQVQVSEGGDPERAEDEANGLIERLGLFQRLDDWARLSFRDGDSFLELSVDGEGLIQDVTRKPTLEMHRASNDRDQFDDASRAFWWADTILGDFGPPKGAVWFPEWMVVHARFGHDEGSRYGRPLFAAARGSWKRVNEGEVDIAIRRKTRAGMKYVHVVEGASEPELEAYKERNKDALDNPFAAVADFFSNRAGMIQAVQGDARLGEIEDVAHHIRTWWISSPVPMSLLGYGQDLNRDVLEEQRAQYDRALSSVTEWVTGEFVKPLLTRQWLLRGIWAGGLKYEVSWAVKQALNATILKDLAEALLKLRATALFTDELLIRMAAQIVPGIDVEALIAEMGRQKERPDEIERMGSIA